MQEGIDVFEAVLDERSLGQTHILSQGARLVLGAGLHALGKRDNSTVHLERAVEFYDEVLKDWAQECELLVCGDIKFSLGRALLILGERESGTERLKEAEQAYRAALEEFAQERVPLQWAATQIRRGDALLALGERESDTALLKEAEEVYQKILKVLKNHPAETALLLRAESYFRLGDTWRALGERENSTKRLKDAAAAFGETLKVITRGWLPLVWAEVQTNLGKTLFSLGQQPQDRAKLEAAREAVSGAFDVYMQDGQEHRRDEFEDLLREIDEALAQMAAAPPH